MNKTYILKSMIFLISPVSIACLWQSIYSSKFYDPLLFPSLLSIGKVLVQLLSTTFGRQHITATLQNVLLGFTAATIIGVPLGLVLGASKNLYRASHVMLHFFRSLPATAIFPVFLLFFGINDAAKIAISCFITVRIILLTSAYGVRYGNHIRRQAAKTLGDKGIRLYMDILFFDSLPHIMAGLRTACSMALIVVIVTEFFVGTRLGIGQQLYDSYVVYDTSRLFARVIVAGTIGYLLNALMTILEKRLIHRYHVGTT